MLLDRRSIQALNEDDLRQRILIPLFVAMGFKDVNHNHGAAEMGKDILMWKAEVVRSRVNHAVVVKAEPINSSNREDVQSQIEQCFGVPFEDPVTGEEREVDRVIVASSRKITPAARKQIRGRLGLTNLNERVDFIDGHLLMEKVSSFLTKEVIWESIMQAYRALNESFEEYRWGFLANPDGSVTVFIGNEPGERVLETPIELSVAAQFPATAEGAKKRLEALRHFEEGTGLVLASEFITDFEVPDFIKTLQADGKLQEIHMAPSPLDPPMIRSLELKGSKGTTLVVDYVHFTHVAAGTRKVRITNQGQVLPWSVELLFDRETPDQGTFRLSLERGEDPIDARTQFHRLLLSAIMAEGGQLVVRDWETDIPQFRVAFSANGEERVPQNALEMTQALALLQARTATLFEIDDATEFTGEDFETALRAAQIVSSGHFVFTRGATLDLTLEARADSEEGIPKDGDNEEFSRLIEDDQVVTVLGRDISLGPAVLLYRGPVQLVEALDECKPPKAGKYRVVASEATPLVMAYPHWQSPLAEPRPIEVTAADETAAREEE